jgi:hypothetical protein
VYEKRRVNLSEPSDHSVHLELCILLKQGMYVFSHSVVSTGTTYIPREEWVLRGGNSFSQKLKRTNLKSQERNALQAELIALSAVDKFIGPAWCCHAVTANHN